MVMWIKVYRCGSERKKQKCRKCGYGCGTKVHKLSCVHHALYWHSIILFLLEIQVTDETYELLYCLLPAVAEFTVGRLSRLKSSYGAGKNISIGMIYGI